MGQLLRITLDGNDYTFKLLSIPAPGQDNRELKVRLEGQERVLRKNNNNWQFSEEDSENRLADAIGKAIALRFRI